MCHRSWIPRVTTRRWRYCSLNAIIEATNEEITHHNSIVENQKQQRQLCTDQVREHLAAPLEPTVTAYTSEHKTLSDQIAAKKASAQQAQNEINNQDIQIRQARASIVDTRAVMDKINIVLKDSGIEGFYLAEVPGCPDAYRVVRPVGSTATNLSEGERDFIAFLYFFFLVHGSISQTDSRRARTVVIDDPVSSMDSGALFIVAAHVRELISVAENNVEYQHNRVQGNFIKQIFILTHNPYFSVKLAKQASTIFDMRPTA